MKITVEGSLKSIKNKTKEAQEKGKHRMIKKQQKTKSKNQKTKKRCIYICIYKYVWLQPLSSRKTGRYHSIQQILIGIYNKQQLLPYGF